MYTNALSSDITFNWSETFILTAFLFRFRKILNKKILDLFKV